MAVEAQIVVGIKAEVEGGRRIKRTLDDVANSNAMVENSSKRVSNALTVTDRANIQLAKSLNRSTKANQLLAKQIESSTKTLRDFNRKSKEASEGANRLGKSVKSTSDSFANLKKVVIGFISLATARQLARISDSMTEVNNRIKVVTDSAEEFNAAFEQVTKIANTTRQSISDTANIYSRFKIATDDLNLSLEDQGKLVQAIQQTFRIAGASTQEAANASIQLAQGLASGALRGDEFRSVSEQNAVLTGLLAEKFGVARGALKDLAAEGKITADVVVASLIPAFDGLNTQADELTLKVSEATTLLSNQFSLYIRQSSVVMTATDVVSASIIGLANNLQVIISTLGTTAAIIASYVIATKGVAVATGIASASVAAFNGLLIANPIGLFVAALAGATIAFFKFKDELEATLIFALSETIVLLDEIIIKMNEFNRIVSTGFKASFAGLKNLLGITSNEEFNQTLLSLKQVTETPFRSVFDRKAARQAANDLIEDLSRDQVGTKAIIPFNLTPRASDSQAGQQFTGKNNIDQINEALKDMNNNILAGQESFSGLQDGIDDLKRTTNDFSNSISSSFANFITGASSAKDALRGLASDLLRIATRQFITAPLTNLLGGIFGGITGGLGGSGGVPVPILNPFRSAPIPGFASGGSMVLGGNAGIDQNLLSLNGQPISRVSRGETLSVSPNDRSGGGITVNQNINVSTGVIDTVRAEILQIMPQIQENTRAAVKEAQLRGIA